MDWERRFRCGWWEVIRERSWFRFFQKESLFMRKWKTLEINRWIHKNILYIQIWACIYVTGSAFKYHHMVKSSSYTQLLLLHFNSSVQYVRHFTIRNGFWFRYAHTYINLVWRMFHFHGHVSLFTHHIISYHYFWVLDTSVLRL